MDDGGTQQDLQKNTPQKKLWFKAKRYGYGWYPATWEGWVVLLVYLAIFVFIFRKVDLHSHSGSDTIYGISIPIIILTIALIAVCAAKGEKARWRWGDDKNEKR